MFYFCHISMAARKKFSNDEHEPVFTFKRIEKFHPLKTMIYVMIAGITVLFFTMMLLFAGSQPGTFLNDKPFPKSFFASTALILVSSWFIHRAVKSFDSENPKRLLQQLLIVLLLAVLFCITQTAGWQQLWSSGIALKGSSSGAFLYIISGLHLAHVAGGMLFLVISIIKALRVRNDGLQGMVYFTDPVEKIRIRMLARYWHFLDGLWVLLFVYFIWFFV